MEGLLPLWKERGMTSHDCVFKLRKIVHTKKSGMEVLLIPTLTACYRSASEKQQKSSNI